MPGSVRLGQLVALFVEVEFAVLELLVAESVEGHFALAAVLVATLFAALLQGQTFLLLPPLLCPLHPCLYLTLVLM